LGRDARSWRPKGPEGGPGAGTRPWPPHYGEAGTGPRAPRVQGRQSAGGGEAGWGGGGPLSGGIGKRAGRPEEARCRSDLVIAPRGGRTSSGTRQGRALEALEGQAPPRLWPRLSRARRCWSDAIAGSFFLGGARGARSGYRIGQPCGTSGGRTARRRRHGSRGRLQTQWTGVPVVARRGGRPPGPFRDSNWTVDPVQGGWTAFRPARRKTATFAGVPRNHEGRPAPGLVPVWRAARP